jgi:hypothetical protein
MCASIFRRGKHRQRRKGEVPVSPLRKRARIAAEAIHSDSSARWFPVTDVFPIYNYLYDYFNGRAEDARLRRIAQEALARLHDVARRVEASAVNPLPPDWDRAKAALAEVSAVIEAVTGPW